MSLYIKLFVTVIPVTHLKKCFHNDTGNVFKYCGSNNSKQKNTNVGRLHRVGGTEHDYSAASIDRKHWTS